MEDKKDELSLTTSLSDLEQKLIAEQDTQELQQIVDLFNLNIRKKDILRARKLSNLQDKISDQMQARVEEHADEFSNKDLLDYFKTIQDTLSKSDTLITPENMPAIQINQQNLNITVGETSLNKESKDKVMDKVKELLAKYSQPSQDIIESTCVVQDSQEDIENSESGQG